MKPTHDCLYTGCTKKNRELNIVLVSLKFTELLNIWIVLLIFNKLESGQIAWYLRELWKKKMVDHILEIPGLVVFGVDRYFTKLCLQNNPACKKDDIEVVI